jgi:hypothetical protein
LIAAITARSIDAVVMEPTEFDLVDDSIVDLSNEGPSLVAGGPTITSSG